MKLIDKHGDIIRLEMTYEEFNIIRQTNMAAILSTTNEEAIEMIGLGIDQLYDFGDSIVEIAEKSKIAL